jgi:hypothetical protein
MISKKIRGGATIWARQTIDSDIFFWRPDKWFKIWFFIVNEVNHKDTKWFKRGEGLFTYEQIHIKCKATVNQVKHCLDHLRKDNMIATHRTTRGLVINVLKYNLFQDLKSYYFDNKSQLESQLESQLKANQKPIKSPTINKNDKNANNDKNDIIATTPVVADTPFSLKSYLETMKSDKCRHIQIIALYWEWRGLDFGSKELTQKAISRDLRPAKALVGYTNKEIEDTMDYIDSQKFIKKPTLETVNKYVAELKAGNL